MKINNFANTNVFAMRKGQTQQTANALTTDTNILGDYSGNFLTKSLYETPLNPLLVKGNISEDFADFRASGGFYSSGVLVNGAIASANSTRTIIVDTGGDSTFSPTDRFKVGDFVYDDSQALVGTIKSLSSTIITLEEDNLVTLADDENLQVRYQTITSYEIHKADNTTLTGVTAGINQSHRVISTFTLNGNTTVDSGDTTGIVAGMSVTGNNIPAGATVSSVNANGVEFVLSTSASGSGSEELTFFHEPYNTINRKYPNNNTGISSVFEYLSNLDTTKGNIIKTYDYDNNTGQRFFTDKDTLSSGLTETATSVSVSSAANFSVNDIIVINNEEMLVTAKPSGLTVVRGFNNTVPTTHASGDKVFIKDSAEHLWVLVYADDPNLHHFAKVTEILESEVWGDTIEFTPSLGVDIPKGTKYAIFDSYDANLPELDSDNQTLVACGYGLQGTQDNDIHSVNTYVSRPFFHFLNGKDRLEPATRYVLRTASSTGINHFYSTSVFVTAQEYGADIIDYGPYTMEATVVDMLYKADDPVAVDTLQYLSDNLALTNGSPDTITVGTDASFDNSITDFFTDVTDVFTGASVNWGLKGILKDSRFRLTGAQTGIYIVEGNSSTATTLTMNASDFSGASTSNSLSLFFTGHAVDLDHNKIYCVFNSDHVGSQAGGFFKMNDAFRMAHRPNNDTTNFYNHAIGQTRYMHYTDSPLTNNIAPNAMEMIDYESVTSTGGYVDIVFADTQKILAKKMKEGDPLFIHEIIFNEEQGLNRVSELGTFTYHQGETTLTVDNLTENEDIRFSLMSPIPNSRTDTGTGVYDPLYEGFTVSISGVLYHIIPDIITNPSSGSQTITPRLWRKETDTVYNTTTLAGGGVPSFSTTGYRRKYSYLVDNIITDIPIDSHLDGYSLDYTSGSAAPTNRGLTTFKNTFETTGATINVGSNAIEKQEHTRVNNINLILRGGSATGHRINVEYGDKYNKFIKLKTHLKDERFLESYNKTDYLPYADGLSNTSLYSYPLNSGLDAGGTYHRYDLARSPNAASQTHVRGILSYLDYFKGAYDIEKRVFSGIIESIEQVIEDGMFKLKVRGRNDVGKLLGPIVNKDFKFTEDIVYSTVGPFERMSLYGQIQHPDNGGVYQVGTTSIVIEHADASAATTSITEGYKGDLLFTTQGVFIGRIYNITGSDPFTITFEEGIPTRLKNDEPIMISSQFSFNVSGTADDKLSNIVPEIIDDDSAASSFVKQSIRGNTISFAKAMSANPYSTIRVNSLSGTRDKGIIFNSGNSLSLTGAKAPAIEGNTLVGTSSSSHPLAKGYSIHAPENIDYDLPFYCHLADEITDKYTIDFVNLHTVNSLTEYDIINISSKEQDTVIEVAPICPAVLGRVDDNPLDGRDKNLIWLGLFEESLPEGHKGIFEFSTWIEELKEGDFIFDADGILFGKIIDISTGSSDGLANDRVAFTLDRPLFKNITSREGIYKYYSSASPPKYIASTSLVFAVSTSLDDLGGPDSSNSTYTVSTLTSTDSTTIEFLNKLEEGMRIYIEGNSEYYNNGLFSIAQVFKDSGSTTITFASRKQSSGHRNLDSIDAFKADSAGDSVRITVMNDYFTQGLYFLNTQGLGQGGVVTLVDNYLSSPNAADNICKPIKWSSGLYHYITDLSFAHSSAHNGSSWQSQAFYNPNDDGTTDAHEIYSDMIDRYGNFKWRYFGLQRGMALSYINRRRKDGNIKDAYNSEKGRVNGYATAYRLTDAKFASNKIMKYPYGYHNNDFSWAIRRYDEVDDAYGDLWDSTNLIKTHPYFLEYLSPESRDFRPILGSNFADFDKTGTTVSSPEHSDYVMFQHPRYMPRMHDNFRGGDWQEDMEAPVNTIDTAITYKKFKALGSASDVYDYDIEYTAGDNPCFIDTNANDDQLLPTSILGQWVKLSGWPDRNNNRAFKLESSFTGSSSNDKIKMDVTKPPFTQIGVGITGNVEVRGSDANSTGFEEITVLYPPWIGPKFDGITRAKDHWELPDPKTMRWFIFSPSDMYPDSMARKHHIGYSGTVDSTAVSRSFTDYSIFVKGASASDSSNVNHEFYEGTLLEEKQVDDQYQNIPISEASITPSEMKRFGLMRLIDCTYDWHFNLLDPERLPSDMAKLNTPNFEYTRFQPLTRIDLIITGYSGTDNKTVTFDGSDPASVLVNGDQIFTDKGKYIGKVADANPADGTNTTITLVGAPRKPILKSDGTYAYYYGTLNVCGDGTNTITAQDYWDSFFQFTTKGRGAKNTFTQVGDDDLNMLQGMVNGVYGLYYLGSSMLWFQLAYGSINGSSYADGTGTDSTGGSSANELEFVGGSDINAITASKFMTHFNESFRKISHHQGAPCSPLYTLPPAFRTFYSDHVTDAVANGQNTINVLQAKEKLVIKADNDANASTNMPDNDIHTEYNHASNILYAIQKGANPYSNCEVVSLGRYNIEQSISKIPTGGKIRLKDGHQVGDQSGSGNAATTEGFAWSKPKRSSAATNADLAEIKYGDGIGSITDSDLTNTGSGEYSIIVTKGQDEFGGYSQWNVDVSGTTIKNYHDPDNSLYVADGVYGAFIPQLKLRDIDGSTLSAGTVTESQEGTITFDSINGSNNKMGVLRIVTAIDSATYDNPFLDYVDLTGMYLVGNLGYEVGAETELYNYYPFNGADSHASMDNLSARTSDVNNSSPRLTSMNDTVVPSQHIIYVKEHRRNSTGKTVAHELLIDNVPHDKSGNVQFFANYRVMRPAETCLWPQTPSDLNLYTLSSRTTKMPQENRMYGHVPNLSRVNSEGEFLGSDPTKEDQVNTTSITASLGLENEAVLSMYVVVDMDSKHAQQKTLTGAISSMTTGLSTLTGNGSTLFNTELQVGDVIKVSNQRCYVTSISANNTLTIAGEFANTASSGNIVLLNNSFTVLRDYIHMFNPTGNRNTFKHGESYSMLLNDGVSKQKTAISVEADYYDRTALCRLTLNDSINQPMYGIVSFGEIFTLKSNVPSKIDNPVSARIGSTVVIGQEVEDVINNLLSSEDIQYDIQDDREYPYYIAPNYQGVDIFNAANFAAKYKEKEIRLDEIGTSLIKQTNDRDYRPIVLSYDNTDLKIISVTRNKSTFDLYNEIIVYGNGVKAIKRNRKSIDKFGKKTLEDVNMELISQDDVDSRAKTLLSAHSKGDDRFTVRMAKNGIELIRAGDIITLDFPAEGIDKGQYKIYEIRRELMGLVELEVGTYRKDLANRFAELSILNKANSSSIRGSQFNSTTAPLDFFDTIKLKELRLVIKKISLADTSAFTLGFQTLTERKLDFGTTMQPLETTTTIITDDDLI